jgi:deoxyinosine 3'endonuclease (endonuclease V)
MVASGSDSPLCVAADVHYLVGGGALAAAVLAADAAFSVVLDEVTAEVPEVAAHRPGQLFARELPPLQAVLSGVSRLGLLVVDGYVDLDPAGRPGLGAHAYAEFGVPVIGVAKTAFRGATHPGPPDDRAVPAARCAAPRRCPGRAGPSAKRRQQTCADVAAHEIVR